MATDTQLLTRQSLSVTSSSAVVWYDVSNHSTCSVQLVPVAVTGTWVVTLLRSNDKVMGYAFSSTVTLTGTNTTGAMSDGLDCSSFRYLGISTTQTCAAGTLTALVNAKADR